ncbi:hypothetical protein HY091_03480 [Candidatus Kaiserbacteria bacterium]|nr:hypothetical protein [Candidatus Kaiserbacteria bacterium]
MYYYSVALLVVPAFVAACLEAFIPSLAGRGYKIVLWIEAGFGLWILTKDAALIDIVHHALH